MNMQKYNWGFESEPEPRLGGDIFHCRAPAHLARPRRVQAARPLPPLRPLPARP